MLRRIVLLILTSLTLQARAGTFDFVPAKSDFEKSFRDRLNGGDYQRALKEWPFGDRQDQSPLFAYLLFQNGMPYLGLDLVLNSSQPNQLPAPLLNLWEKEIKASSLIQKGYLQTRGGWRSIVNNETVSIRIQNKKDIAAAFAKAERADKDQINYKARILWQIATLAPLLNETDPALKALKILSESGQTAIGRDQILSAQARALYQRGEIDAALNAYNQIPKSSSLWIESVEERAWAHLRRDDFDKALGETVTLLSPALAPLVGPESYFLANLMSLKACDYPRIFKNSELFKQRHRNRIVELQDLASKGSSKNSNALLDRFEKGGVSLEAAGPLIGSLPRSALRDRIFVKNLEVRKQILGEIALAQGKDLSPSLSTSSVLAKVMGTAKVRADQGRGMASSRMRTLAAFELKEYRTILNKMHIVEAEVIERLHVDDSLKGERSKLSKNDDQGDVLVFPYSSDEVWLDELDNYKARVKDCPTLKGASL